MPFSRTSSAGYRSLRRAPGRCHHPTPRGSRTPLPKTPGRDRRSGGRAGRGDRLVFAPIGVSQVADQARALVKSGVLRGVSIGFDPKETESLDPKKPYGGQRITKSELL
jgi:hypothetical protein